MTREQLVKNIHIWENTVDESFTDYFMHDNVNDGSWAFWLLGKGFTEQALTIINEIANGNMCIDQETLYEVFPVYNDDHTEWYREIYDKNVELWAEFLTATPYYTNIIIEWLKEENVRYGNMDL